MVPRLLFNFTRRSTPRRARLPSRAARHLASRGQLRAMKPSTTHAIKRRDVIYRAIRCRLTRVVCLDTCRFLRQWPPTRRRRHQSSQTTRFLVGTAYCAVHYHYHYCSPTRTSLVPPSQVVTSQLRAALATVV